jgi:hypothetical protein
MATFWKIGVLASFYATFQTPFLEDWCSSELLRILLAYHALSGSLLLPTKVLRRLHTRCIIRRVPPASGTPKRNAASTHSASAYLVARPKHPLNLAAL